MWPLMVLQRLQWLPPPTGIWEVSVGQVPAHIALEGREAEAEREGRSFQTEGIVCQLHEHVTDYACQNPMRNVVCLALGRKGSERQVGTRLGRAFCAHAAFRIRLPIGSRWS